MDHVDSNALDALAARLNHMELGACYLSVKMDAFVSSHHPQQPQRRIARSRKSLKQEMRPAVESPYLMSGVLEVQPTETVTLAAAEEEDASSDGNKRRRSASWGLHSYRRPPQRRRTSSLGDLSEPSSKALFMDMIEALNEAFPDYDFGDSKLQQFQDTGVGSCVQQINSHLAELTLHSPMVLEEVWSTIDDMVGLRHCEVFAFLPPESDAEDEFLWRFHFFFFNKPAGRLLYFSCGAKSLLRKRGERFDSDEESEDGDDDDLAGDGDEVAIRRADSDDEGQPTVALAVTATEQLDDLDDDDDAEDVPEWDGII